MDYEEFYEEDQFLRTSGAEAASAPPVIYMAETFLWLFGKPKLRVNSHSAKENDRAVE